MIEVIASDGYPYYTYVIVDHINEKAFVKSSVWIIDGSSRYKIIKENNPIYKYKLFVFIP